MSIIENVIKKNKKLLLRLLCFGSAFSSIRLFALFAAFYKESSLL